jgi:predicted alpha/beta hydrolase
LKEVQPAPGNPAPALFVSCDWDRPALLDRPARRIGLLGHSRGGGEAVLAAAEDPRVDALVTWASIADVSGWMQRVTGPYDRCAVCRTLLLCDLFCGARGGLLLRLPRPVHCHHRARRMGQLTLL